MTTRTCARGRWGLQEALGICHGRSGMVPNPWGTATAHQSACVGLSPESGTAALGPSTYNNQCSLTAYMGIRVKEDYLFFIRLQVGLMKVKAYSRLVFFLNSALHRTVSQCIPWVGRAGNRVQGSQTARSAERAQPPLAKCTLILESVTRSEIGSRARRAGKEDPQVGRE